MSWCKEKQWFDISKDQKPIKQLQVQKGTPICIWNYTASEKPSKWHFLTSPKTFTDHVLGRFGYSFEASKFKETKCCKSGPVLVPWKFFQETISTVGWFMYYWYRLNDKLVGGFNPSEKYARQIGNLPPMGVKINKWKIIIYVGLSPFPVIVTTRIISCLGSGIPN